jgi:hypothetical protein
LLPEPLPPEPDPLPVLLPEPLPVLPFPLALEQEPDEGQQPMVPAPSRLVQEPLEQSLSWVQPGAQ